MIGNDISVGYSQVCWSIVTLSTSGLSQTWKNVSRRLLLHLSRVF